MQTIPLPGVDILTVAFFVAAVLALIWALARRQVSSSDEEASAVLWKSEDAARGDLEVTVSPSRKRSRLAAYTLFALICALVIAAPIITVVAAHYGGARAAMSEGGRP